MKQAALDIEMRGDGDNGLWAWLEARAPIYLAWNQYGRCGDTELDFHVLDVAGGGRTLIGGSEDVQDRDGETCSPTERLTAIPPRADWYRIEVEHVGGTRADLHVDLLTRSGYLLEPTATRSVTDPAAHPLAVAVGAVNAAVYQTGNPESFSAWGPNHAGWPKPDIVGPDGLSLDAAGTRGFSGTSGSAPVVAGLVALVMSEDPGLSSREAFQRLQGWALRTEPGPAPDPRFGAGKARLPVPDPASPGCGRRPLVMPLVLLLPLWFRRKR